MSPNEIALRSLLIQEKRDTKALREKIARLEQENHRLRHGLMSLGRDLISKTEGKQP